MYTAIDFTHLSKLIRELHDEHVYENHVHHEWKKQFINLSGSIVLLKWTIMFAAFGFLFNMITVLGLYLNEVIYCSKNNFWFLLFINDYFNTFFIREIHISTNALKLHMSDMDVNVRLRNITAGPKIFLPSKSS